jgi:hypothetical protein
MPISSYPRFVLEQTDFANNPQNGIGIAILNQDNGIYKIADSNLFPLNTGGIASNNSIYELIQNLTAIDYTNESAGNILFQILIELQTLNSNLANGTNAIKIQGANGGQAHITSNRLDVRVG